MIDSHFGQELFFQHERKHSWKREKNAAQRLTEDLNSLCMENKKTKIEVMISHKYLI